MSWPFKQPLKIHHIEGRRSFRIAWLCEELGIPYELIFTRGDLMASMAQIRAAHPLMPVAPTVEYDGQMIVESGAILELLQARHADGRFAPAVDSPDYPMHLQWLHFAEASAMARIGMAFALSTMAGVAPNMMPPGYHKDADPAELSMVGPLGVFQYMEDFLSRHRYFGGAEISIADIMMEFAIRGAKLAVWIWSEDYPHIWAWRQAVEARPAFQRAQAACTPGGADEFGMPADIPLPPTFVPPPPRG